MRPRSGPGIRARWFKVSDRRCRMKAVLSFFVLAALAASFAPASAQAVPERLASLCRAYLDTRSPDAEFQLRAYGVKSGGDAGALAHFVLGYAQWQDKHFAEAAQYLHLARAGPTLLADYADYYLVSALQDSGDESATLPLLDGFDSRYPGSLLTARALYAQAVALAATDSPSRAVVVLNTHPDSLPHPAADLLLAKAYAADGKTAQAMAAYAGVYYQYPASAEGEEAAKYKARFPKPTPGLLGTRAALLVAAAASRPAMQRARMYLEAQGDYQSLAAATKGVEHENAEVAAAMVLYKMGRNPQARAALAGLEPASAETDAERLYWLAECDRRLRREPEMDADLQRLQKRYPVSPWLEEALYSLGNYELIHGGTAGGMAAAAPYYDELARRFPDGKYASQSHWKVAWSHYRAGDYAAARIFMDEQIRKYPASPLAVAAIYWSGRLRENNENAGAQAYYRKAVEGFPSNFYGFLARERLTVPVTHLGAPYVAPLAPADSAFFRQQFALMQALGLFDLEAGEIRQMLQASGREKDQAFWYLQLAEVERERGRYNAALDAARRATPNYTQLDPHSIPYDIWELLYPLPWWQEVRDQAAAAELDPYLIAGLIRQESAFNEHAISPSNAYGLMQILPRTGRELSRKLGIPGYSTNSLFNPRVNIRMGVHYLKGLIEDHGGRLEDALAAYNAGPDRVESWRQGGFKDVNEFVESIPFSETREYVQIVLRNAEIYRRLYAPREAAGTQKSAQNISQ
jgi:soluble lytic murein transglycosylase